MFRFPSPSKTKKNERRRKKKLISSSFNLNRAMSKVQPPELKKLMDKKLSGTLARWERQIRVQEGGRAIVESPAAVAERRRLDHLVCFPFSLPALFALPRNLLNGTIAIVALSLIRLQNQASFETLEASVNQSLSKVEKLNLLLLN